jgi:hypothetical protein
MKSRFRHPTSIRPGRVGPSVELELWWPEGTELQRALVPRDGVAEIVYMCAPDPGVPDDVVVGSVLPTVFRIGVHEREFRAHLRVVERNLTEDAHTLRLTFMSEERDRQELITLAASGESIPYLRRGAERLPCSLSVEGVSEAGANFTAEATDLSERGLYLATDPTGFRIDSRVDLALPEMTARVGGRVVSIIRSGPSRGIGVEFVFTSKTEVEQIRSAVARLRARL